MSKGAEVGPNQESFISSESISLEGRQAFGRVANEAYWGLVDEDLAQYEDLDLTVVEPKEIMPVLFGPGPLTVREGVALPPEEYTNIIRNIDAFQKGVVNNRLGGKGRLYSYERRRSKASSGGRAAIRGMLDKMEKMHSGIVNELETLATLQMKAHSPDFALLQAEHLRVFATSAWHLSFSKMLDVLSLQQDWSAVKFENAEKALAARLLTAGPGSEGQRTKVKYWQEMLATSSIWAEARQSVFEIRLAKASRKLSKKQESE